MGKLTTRVAVVTGAGSGIGRASAALFAREGATVVAADINRDGADATVEQIAKAGGSAIAVAVDVARGDSVAAMIETALARFGRIDVLFNNAGIGAPPVPMEELPVEKWKEVVDTNLTACFVCTQEAIKIMKDQKPRGGRIINNGSISAHTPRPFSVAYTSTKHAITGLTKSTALDGRAYDIACGQVDIGNAATPMTERMVDGVLQPSGQKVPEPRMDADHVGSAVLYMANLPLDANVLFMTVMATKMPFVGRG